MNFNPIYQLHKIACVDMYRPAMQYIYFKGEYAYATDAHALIRIRIDELIREITPEQIAMLENHGIHNKTFSKIYRAKYFDLTLDGIVIKDEWGDITTYRLTDFGNYDGDGGTMRFPNCDAIIEECKSAKEKPITKFGVNSEYLHNLSKAMGNVKNVGFIGLSTRRAIRIIDATDKESQEYMFALIMPVLIDD